MKPVRQVASSGPIVTLPDGTRYRHRQQVCVLGHLSHFTGPEAQSSCVEELPRIPDWPLPGLAPQYLAKDPLVSQLEKGDRVLVLQPELRSWMWHWDFDKARQRDHDWHGYLIARRNPEADL